ncbi:PqiC family protein [Acinetobacter larvae]|uniref:ABC-type transport auxiliary lipoprotein component domain-containing protein n=1 Tax=Acinetobacter larvae TaxID=1789224 RepID=A0A1B2M2W1_9GAMM|nr:ABC-type transport auxiliary lipoprotein family protein [Acinetobacter larvae]AOA59527.1 hypothetical protein BFG52_15010 [Acinetobacter larvae]
MKSIAQRSCNTILMMRFTTMIAAVFALSACSSAPVVNYYALNTQGAVLTDSKVRVIEVLPVSLPDRINRVPIVVQDLNGKIKILENERWTSTLAAELRDNLSAGLQQQLGAVDRYNSGMVGGKVAYRIASDFSHFDIIHNPNAQQQIEVAVAWIVKRNDPNTSLEKNTTQHQQLTCRMHFTQSVSPPQQDQPPQHHQMQDTISGANIALNRVVNAMALSIVAFDAQKTAPLTEGNCS